MDSWSLKIIVTPMMPCMSWTEKSCAGSGWSSNMPEDRGETEMATVGVTGVVGAVSAVYYKISSLPLPTGVRCRCGLHKDLYCYIYIHANCSKSLKLQALHQFSRLWGTLTRFTTGGLETHVNIFYLAERLLWVRLHAHSNSWKSYIILHILCLPLTSVV